MKFLKYTLLGLLVLLVVAVIVGWLFLEPIVKGAVNKFGTQVVGTEVKLEGFKFNPFAGEVAVEGLMVANPEGYSAPYLLSLGNVSVKVDPKSLMSDRIVVEDISVSKPEITYEMLNFATNNVMQIQENVAKNTAPTSENAEAKEPAEGKTTDAKPAKSVVIRKVLVEGGVLTAIVPVPVKDSNSLVLNMPAIELTGIGEGSKSMSLSESVTTIFNKILFNATSVVTKALGSASEMAKKAADAAVNEAKEKAQEEAGNLLDKVKFW